jgi:hypothetical protein
MPKRKVRRVRSRMSEEGIGSGAKSVTDSSEGMCVDPGEMGAALQAGGVRGPSPPEGEKGGQLASDSGRG